MFPTLLQIFDDVFFVDPAIMDHIVTPPAYFVVRLFFF